MAKEFAKSFYNSKKWLKAREEYIAERILVDGGLCEDCHQQLGYIVHHKAELTPDNINNLDITLNKNNFSYVCKACHDKKEGHFNDCARSHRQNDQANYYFTSDGMIHPMMIPPHDC